MWSPTRWGLVFRNERCLDQFKFCFITAEEDTFDTTERKKWHVYLVHSRVYVVRKPVNWSKTVQSSSLHEVCSHGVFAICNKRCVMVVVAVLHHLSIIQESVTCCSNKCAHTHKHTSCRHFCHVRHQKCHQRLLSELGVSQNGSAGPFFTQLTLSLFPVQPSNALQHQQHGNKQKRQLPLGERYVIIHFINIILYFYGKLMLKNKYQRCCEMIWVKLLSIKLT